MNYTWIANFGVVPLFLLAAFLLVPLVFALRRLTILVLFVHDAITNSDKIKKTVLFLPDATHNVKAILYLICLFTMKVSVSKASIKEETLILAKGEQMELALKGLKKFSVGNKEVLTTKLDQQGSVLFLKGKSMGFTDLILWEGRKKRHFLVYVISKKHHLEQAKLLEIFEPPQWQVKFEGDDLALNGELLFEHEWKILQRLMTQNYHLRLEGVSLHPSIRRKLITKTYQKLNNLGLEKFQCNILEIPFVNCLMPRTLSQPELALLKDQLPFHRFEAKYILKKPKNVRVKLKILSFDIQEGQHWQKGLDHIKGNLDQLVHGSFQDMVRNNPILFSELANHAHILTEPEFILLPPNTAQFSVGSEIPYTQKDKDDSVTAWKFAGLSLNLKIEKSAEPNIFSVTYSTELTSPQDQNIQGHKQSANMLIKNNSNVALFDLTFQSLTLSNSGIPFWGKIPLLKNLFASEFNIKSQKKILALLFIGEE